MRASELATFVVTPGATTIVVQVSGEIDISNAALLAATLRDVIGDGRTGRPAPRVVLDLSELRFLDAQGLAALVEGQQLAEACGMSFALARPSHMVRKMLSITGLDETFLVAED